MPIVYALLGALVASFLIFLAPDDETEVGSDALAAVRAAVALEEPSEAEKGMRSLLINGTYGVNYQVGTQDLREILRTLRPYGPPRRVQMLSHSIVKSYDSTEPDRVEIHCLIEGGAGNFSEFVFTFFLGDITLATWCTLTKVRQVGD